ncbi:hypothetical protein KY308_02715 [Candidatus Woesearchaeota archaeon]|nr:hypothetical protein [Candidatus Woesearchaeota archaeon]
MVRKSIGMLKECWKEKAAVTKAFLWYMVMFSVVYGFATLIGMIMPKNSYEIMELVQSSPVYIVLFSLISVVYVVAAIFIYSFFKILIMGAVQKKIPKKSSFNRLGSFFLFNILLALIIAAVFVLLGAIINYTFNGSQTASIIYFFVCIFFAYPFLNFSQLEFLKGNKIFRSIKLAVKVFLSNFGQYVRIIITDAVYIGMLLLVFLIVGSIYGLAVAQKTSTAYVTAYNIVFTIAVSLLIVMLASYSLYFFNKIAEEKIKKIRG